MRDLHLVGQLCFRMYDIWGMDSSLAEMLRVEQTCGTPTSQNCFVEGTAVFFLRVARNPIRIIAMAPAGTYCGDNYLMKIS